eukprot:gene8926-1267_t
MVVLLQCATFSKSENARFFHDLNGTTHLMSPNPTSPFAINGVDVFLAMSNIVQCMQTSCPSGSYRTGYAEILATGYCKPCPSCPIWQYRSGCGAQIKAFV